ncbi:DUF6777 domain-containing protein [Streptomyces sp. NPDC002676]
MKQTIGDELAIERMRENTVRIPAGSIVTACALSFALLVSGCVGQSVRETGPGGEVFLQPAADQGPAPFIDSAGAHTPVSPPPATPMTPMTSMTPTRPMTPMTPSSSRSPDPSEVPQRAGGAEPPRGVRALSGATPGLYSGTAHTSGCDVERQIGYLAADRAKGDAFARAAGISRAAIPGYLRGLAPVVLRADTRVTNHYYRDRQASGFQSVLQAGTAVLVDSRGVPRVRCACGNPLKPPESIRGMPSARGTAWSGYRPNEVIMVTPASRTITAITVIDTKTDTWFERRIGHDVSQDHVVPAPAWAAPAGTESPGPGRPSPSPSPSGTGRFPGVEASPPAVTAGNRTDPAAASTGPADPGSSAPGTTASQDPPFFDSLPDASTPDTPQGTGPPDVPGISDLLDVGSLIPDGTSAVRTPVVRTSSEPGSTGSGTGSITGSIFDSPTDVLEN